jgi:electron-transferring-flavoprotein dehydrogenase
MDLPEREAMEFDVVIVGAGPAGLSAAIRLRQIAAEKGAELSVVVVEKGSEVGAHILSGAVIDPIGLDRLLPEWRGDENRPLKTEVTRDEFLYLRPTTGVRMPNVFMPRLMNNHGNFIGSLGNVCRYLGAQAEALGAEIYPGFAATEILTDDQNRVVGVATGDMGVAKDGSPKESFTRGMELRARYTVFAEGARGNLAKQVVDRFGLNQGRDHQKYGIGLKELWQVRPEKHQPGLVQHSMGWPLENNSGGGSWLYHFDDNLVSVGFVVHLNYENPTLSPFDEFQRVKTHPKIRDVFEGGKRLGYGARAILEGGWQSAPRLSFPGGCLVGDTAGFVNVPRIKGTHNAVLSGMLCAEHLFEALAAGRAHDEVSSYEDAWRESEFGQDLYRVRNIKPLWSKYGTLAGRRGRRRRHVAEPDSRAFPFGTMEPRQAGPRMSQPLSEWTPISYPKPDGVLTFDKLSSVFLSNTNHEEDQPSHLRVLDMELQKRSEHDVYAGPSQRYCPAGVYEWVDDGAGDARYVINAQNCVHCKTCDIKDPNQNIVWVPPEGGGGPNYQNM